MVPASISELVRRCLRRLLLKPQPVPCPIPGPQQPAAGRARRCSEPHKAPLRTQRLLRLFSALLVIPSTLVSNVLCCQ